MKRPLWRRLWNSPREATFDVVLVVVLSFLGHVLAYFFPSDTPPQAYDWIGGQWVGQLIGHFDALMLLVRRRHPVVLMVLLTVVSVAQVLSIELVGPLIPLNMTTDPWVPGMAPFVIYAFAVYATGRWPRVAGWVLVAVVTLLAVRPWHLPAGIVITNALVLTAFPALLGLYVGARHRLMQAWRERAERAEREQHLLAEQARAEERTRLASEMHDVVTHRVSLMVLQAGALGVTARDEATRSAAEELRAAGCQALEELRDLVGVLRQTPDRNDEHGAAEPSAAPDLSALVTESESVGVPVRFDEDGDRGKVSPTVGRTAYRVVQEALTNARKHALGAEVLVRVRYGPSQVRLTVRNTAASIHPDLAASGSGTGLRGLRQRVELVGGTLRAEPTDDGGFEVDAILPAYVPTGEGAHDA